jgi:predicted RNA-binding protein with PIN domain
MQTKKPRNTKEAKLLVVDGYNVIRAGSLYQHLNTDTPDHSDDTFNTAREALLSDVCSFAADNYAATVVFDGADNPLSEGTPKTFGTISYLFSPRGVSADTIIEEMTHTAVRAGREVLVVTSDATVQWTVFGKQVTRMSAAGFCREVLAIRQMTAELSTPGARGGTIPAIKNTLGSRLDAQTRKALEKMARGDKSDTER